MSVKIDTKELLKQHGLKATPHRISVLKEMTAASNALSQPELEKKLGSEMDRVTLYRVLSILEDKGILHTVLDKSGTTNYAICKAACSEGHHHDEHLHFNCTSCRKVYCLDILLPQFQLPDGFQVENVVSIAYGICNDCKAKI